jgi:hypothetical protein
MYGQGDFCRLSNFCRPAMSSPIRDAPATGLCQNGTEALCSLRQQSAKWAMENVKLTLDLALALLQPLLALIAGILILFIPRLLDLRGRDLPDRRRRPRLARPTLNTYGRCRPEISLICGPMLALAERTLRLQADTTSGDAARNTKSRAFPGRESGARAGRVVTGLDRARDQRGHRNTLAGCRQ